MQVPDTLQAWLKEAMIPLSILALFLVVIVIILQLSAVRRRRALLKERAGHTEDVFVSHLSTFGFDPRISRTTYRFLQEERNIAFPVLLRDTLDEDLGMDSTDVEESVSTLLAANGRILLPGLRHNPLVTVEDLIRFIQASPRIGQKAA